MLSYAQIIDIKYSYFRYHKLTLFIEKKAEIKFKKELLRKVTNPFTMRDDLVVNAFLRTNNTYTDEHIFGMLQVSTQIKINKYY